MFSRAPKGSTYQPKKPVAIGATGLVIRHSVIRHFRTTYRGPCKASLSRPYVP